MAGLVPVLTLQLSTSGALCLCRVVSVFSAPGTEKVYLSGSLLLESRFHLFIDMYSFPIYVYESRYIFNVFEFLLDCFFPPASSHVSY